jgi:hypothetical protein
MQSKFICWRGRPCRQSRPLRGVRNEGDAGPVPTVASRWNDRQSLPEGSQSTSYGSRTGTITYYPWGVRVRGRVRQDARNSPILIPRSIPRRTHPKQHHATRPSSEATTPRNHTKDKDWRFRTRTECGSSTKKPRGSPCWSKQSREQDADEKHGEGPRRESLTHTAKTRRNHPPRRRKPEDGCREGQEGKPQ